MICVYDIGNEEYTRNGNAVLHPTECIVTEAAGGTYELNLTHPTDGEWAHLVCGAIIKAPVPVSVIESSFVGQEADVYSCNTKTNLREGPSDPSRITYQTWVAGTSYAVGAKVTFLGQNYQLRETLTGQEIYTDPGVSSKWMKIANYSSGAAVLTVLPAGTEVYYVSTSSSWYKVQTKQGIEGYVKQSEVTFVRHETVQPVPQRTVTDQLFRIYEVNVSTGRHSVTVNARHVSYDLGGILVGPCDINNAQPSVAIMRIIDAMMMEYKGEIATDLTTAQNGNYTGDASNKNAMNAFLDPDKGMVPYYRARLYRDNWDWFIMHNDTTDRGVRLAYGRNLRGVTWKRKTDAVITRVMPVAKAADGSDLYLPEMWVDSAESWPFITMERLNVDGQVGKDKGDGTNWTEAALYTEMRSKASARFTDDGVDEMAVELTVDFTLLGDTEEYKAYKGLEKLFMYDTVRVTDETVGMDLGLQVSEIRYDCIMERYAGIKVGGVFDYGGGTISSYMIKSGSINSRALSQGAVDTRNLKANAVTANTIDANAITSDKIQANAITAAKIAAGEIQAGHIAAGAITTVKLDAQAVTAEKIAANAVTADKIQAGAITTVKLDAEAVTAEKIKASAVTADKIQAGAVTTGKLDAYAVTAGKLAANAVTAVKISASDIDAINAKLGTALIADAEIANANISYAQIKDASVQNFIAQDAVTDKYFIDKLMVRNAQMVMATIGELVIKASNGNYYRLDIAADGSVSPTQVTLTAGEIAAGKTSDGHGSIIETDLTVADLSASNMKAINALIDKLTASRIDVDELFARSATIAKLNAADISANTSMQLYVTNEMKKALAGGRNYVKNSAANAPTVTINNGTVTKNFTANWSNVTAYTPESSGTVYTNYNHKGHSFFRLQRTTAGSGNYTALNGTPFDLIDFEAGESLVLTFWYYCTQNMKNTFGDSDTLSFFVSRDGSVMAISQTTLAKTDIQTGKWTKVSKTFAPQSLPTTNFRVGVALSGLGDVFFTDVKLEKGTVGTDWTQAPEDITENISAGLTITENSITASVNTKLTNYPTTSDMNTALGNYLLTTELVSQITVNKDSIASVVAAADYDGNGNTLSAKISTIEQTADAVTTKVSNFNSGRNYVKNSAAEFGGDNYWNNITNITPNTNLKKGGHDYFTLRNQSSGTNLAATNQSPTDTCSPQKDEYYTLSFWYYCTQNMKNEFGSNSSLTCYITVNGGTSGAPGVAGTASVPKASIVTGQWTRVWRTFQISTSDAITTMAVAIRLNDTGYIYFTDVQLEKGVFATDWAECEDAFAMGATQLTKDAFSISFNNKDVFKATASDITLDVGTVTATGEIIGNIVNTTPGAIAEDVTCETLQMKLDELPKYLTDNVTLTVKSGSVGTAKMDGFMGPGTLSIVFETPMIGYVRGNNCLCPLSVSGQYDYSDTSGTIVYDLQLNGSTSAIMAFKGCPNVIITGLAICGSSTRTAMSGTGGTQYGMQVTYGSCVHATGMLIDRVGACFDVRYGGIVNAYYTRGGLTSGTTLTDYNNNRAAQVAGNGSIAFRYTYPYGASANSGSGTYGMIYLPSGTTQTARPGTVDPTPPPATTTVTNTYTSQARWTDITGTANWSDNSTTYWTMTSENAKPRIGRVPYRWGTGYQFGMWLFTSANVSTMQAAATVSVTITRTKDYGDAGPVTVELCKTTHTGEIGASTAARYYRPHGSSGNYNLTKTGLTATLARGESATFTLSAAQMSGFTGFGVTGAYTSGTPTSAQAEFEQQISVVCA